MEECSVLIETTKSAEDKTSRWFDLPIDYELFRDLLGVEADSKDYQITDMKLPFAGDIVSGASGLNFSRASSSFTFISSVTATLPDSIRLKCSRLIPAMTASFVWDTPYCKRLSAKSCIHSVSFSAIPPLQKTVTFLVRCHSNKKSYQTLDFSQESVTFVYVSL